MEKILSKEEIAELLSAVRHGEVAVDPAAEPAVETGKRQKASAVSAPDKAAAAERLNLFRAQGPEGWKLHNFDLVLDSFAHNFSISLSNRFQRSVSVKLDAMESMSFDVLLQKFSGRGAIGILQLEPLSGGALMVMDEQLSYSLVEIVLGGSSDTQVVVPSRAMSAIELNVISDVLRSSCPELEKGFLQLQKIKGDLVKVVSNLRLLNFVSFDSGVVAARFRVSIDSLEGDITLVLPHTALEPLQRKEHEKSVPLSTVQNSKWQAVVCGELGHMEVELGATLSNVSLLVRDILNFQVGDVIDLGCNPDTPLKISVEGRSKFYGMAGVQGGKKAIRILGKIPNGG